MGGLGPYRDERGEPIPPHLQANLLGMTETFAVHSGEPVDRPLPAAKAGASGRAVGDCERRVVDPETRLPVPPGQVGELEVRGPSVLVGLYKVDRGQVFTEDGYYPTGDLVRMDEEGWLWFVARRKDMIKTRAANVSRLEVEQALEGLPDVARAFVAGFPTPSGASGWWRRWCRKVAHASPRPS
ncbi:MAG: hypothetical protein KatS3mg124_0646 [Porticoccaceae bacterium]|nr:MAG: hypothetical protein KatS3mg124_0646 [Porticoccaceae bacterium]